MSWRVADRPDLDKIIKYLLIDESISIQPLNLFIINGIYRFPRSHNTICLINDKSDSIDGFIAVTSKGLIYPSFSKETINSGSEKSTLIKLMATINVRIHGVVGLKEDVNFLDSIIFRRVKARNSYIHLKRESKDLFNIDKDLDIRLANIFDLHKLAPLEIEYQKEEVLISPKDLNRLATIENFKRKINNSDIYYINEKNLPISKAGTSYKSKNYTLVGGVFTWRKKRNLGLSTNVLKYLLNDQQKKGFKAALFVKSENKAAIHLYKKLGFTTPRDYSINYYHK